MPMRNQPVEKMFPRKSSWLNTAKIVAWSFVGLRNGKEFQEETQKLNPIHLVVVGVGAAAMFVVGLIFFVRWAVVVAR
jgi:Protein of unknown function (DUF2970)